MLLRLCDDALCDRSDRPCDTARLSAPPSRLSMNARSLPPVQSTVLFPATRRCKLLCATSKFEWPKVATGSKYIDSNVCSAGIERIFSFISAYGGPADRKTLPRGVAHAPWHPTATSACRYSSGGSSTSSSSCMVAQVDGAPTDQGSSCPSPPSNAKYQSTRATSLRLRSRALFPMLPSCHACYWTACPHSSGLASRLPPFRHLVPPPNPELDLVGVTVHHHVATLYSKQQHGLTADYQYALFQNLAGYGSDLSDSEFGLQFEFRGRNDTRLENKYFLSHPGIIYGGGNTRLINQIGNYVPLAWMPADGDSLNPDHDL